MGFLDVIARIGDVIADDMQEFVDICNAPSGTSQPVQNPQPAGGTPQGQVRVSAVPAPTGVPPHIPSHMLQQILSPQPPQRTQTQLFHGGPMEGVLDIFRYNRVKIGRSMPRGFYVMTDIDEAMVYTGYSGGVVELYMPLSVTLENGNSECAFYLPMPDAGVGKYYRIAGMRPVRVFDTNKKQVA